jgi:hypothetical protein
MPPLEDLQKQPGDGRRNAGNQFARGLAYPFGFSGHMLFHGEGYQWIVNRLSFFRNFS